MIPVGLRAAFDHELLTAKFKRISRRRPHMDDNTVVDTDRATQHWNEDTRWDGNNHISVATGSQWTHETLHRSRKGRYYIEHESQWQGSRPSAEWVSNRTAASWLLANDRKVPDDLITAAEEVSE